jgi:lipoyl synthase
VVITAVARDDLPDGGAAHFGRSIEAVRQACPGIVIEVLTPDFGDSDDAIESVLAARPDIFNHNLETVRRLTPTVRHRATYDRSLRYWPRLNGAPPRGLYEIRIDARPGRTREEVLTAMG